MPRKTPTTGGPARRLRASLNVRLSKAASEENTSLEGMIADLRALAAREGFEEVALHVDDGKSGGYRDRPGFQAWIADAREGRADVLLAWHVDRMTREGLNVAATLLDVVEGKDPATGRPAHPPVRLMDAKGLDSEDGTAFRFQFVIAAEIARAERERIRDRARAKDARLREARRWAGGPPPYGYRIVKNPHGPGKALDVAPEEATVIHEAADAVMSGVPLGRVVRRLNARGVRSRHGKDWSRTTLRQVLVGDAVLGRYVVHGEVMRDEDGKAITVWPPVLTVGQSRALRAALAPTPDARKAVRYGARLLSGIVVCHSCGNALQVARRADGSVTYRCQTQSDGGVCAAQVVVAALPFEAWAETFYLATYGRSPETERRLLARPDEDVAALDEAIAATLTALGKAATPEGFARLQDLQARRADAASRAPVGPQMVEVLTGRTKAQAWAAEDVEGRRDMLRRDLPGPVVLGPGRRGRRGFDPARLVDFDLDAFLSPEDLGAGGSPSDNLGRRSEAGQGALAGGGARLTN